MHRNDAQSAWMLLLERCVLAMCLLVPVAAFLRVKSAATRPLVAEGMRPSAARKTVTYGDKLWGNACISES